MYLHTCALVLLLSFTFTFRNVRATTSWGYSDQAAWESESDWYCNGTRQSPIDIDTDDLITYGSLIELTLTNFNQNFTGDFSNTGHSVQFAPDSDLDTATLVNHLGTYELQQFHFHWGPSTAEGSEHTVDGNMYAGELHFVSTKTTGASTDGDAYSVLGVLLVSDSSLSLSGSWSKLYDNIPTVYGDVKTVSGLDLTEFLPSSMSYYHYEGSLTTPPCSEVVQWFVLKYPVSVPADFLTALRTTVEDENGDILTTNYRDTQDLNGRNVMIYNESGTVSSMSFRLSGALLASITLLMTVLLY